MVVIALGIVLAALPWDGLLTEGLPTTDELVFQEYMEYLLSRATAAGLTVSSEDQTDSAFGAIPRYFPGRHGAALGELARWLGASVVLPTDDSRRWRGHLLARVRTDSAGGGTRRAAAIVRAGLEHGPWEVAGVVEKDCGETSLFDFAGGGLRYCSGSLNAVMGNYDFGAGQGLVFSSSYGRSASRLAENAGSVSSLRLVHHADESSPLFGAGGELYKGRVSVVGFFSSTGLDARLNPDGSVRRLESGGVHNDSALQARRNQVRSILGGGAVRFQSATADIGLHAGLVGYSRSFSPDDVSNSFSGRGIANIGITGGANVGPWRVEAEAAACGTGLAAAARLDGAWDALKSRAVVRWHGRRYFAPHGRWTSLTGRQERLEANGALVWQRYGLRLGAEGRTYRDFELDSLPARLELRAGQEFGAFGCDLRLGRNFRLADERHRTARLVVTARTGRLSKARGDVRLTFSDEYPEGRPGRGRSIGGVGTLHLGNWQLDASMARFDITGSGVRMFASEPGAMRIGSSYSTSRSAWRAAVGLAIELRRIARLGLKVGWEYASQAVWDAAAQVDVAMTR